MHILHVESSPRKQRSASIQVAHAFLEEWTRRKPETTVDTLDVWDTDLPTFNGAVLEAKYAGIAGKALNRPKNFFGVTLEIT